MSFSDSIVPKWLMCPFQSCLINYFSVRSHVFSTFFKYHGSMVFQSYVLLYCTYIIIVLYVIVSQRYIMLVTVSRLYFYPVLVLLISTNSCSNTRTNCSFIILCPITALLCAQSVSALVLPISADCNNAVQTAPYYQMLTYYLTSMVGPVSSLP